VDINVSSKHCYCSEITEWEITDVVFSKGTEISTLFMTDKKSHSKKRKIKSNQINKINRTFLSKSDAEVALSEELQTDALDLIDEFCNLEYGETFNKESDLSKIPVAYTTTEDQKHEIQAYVDVLNCRIIKTLDDKIVKVENYLPVDESNNIICLDISEKNKHMQSFIQVLANLSFDDLVSLNC
jgi:hypothetical protein